MNPLDPSFMQFNFIPNSCYESIFIKNLKNWTFLPFEDLFPIMALIRGEIHKINLRVPNSVTFTFISNYYYKRIFTKKY